MANAADRLTSYVDAENPYDVPHSEVAALQLAAARERFEERRKTVKFLEHRAHEARVAEVRELADLVPLLFAHTTYKSYPESWLTKQKWAQLGKWVDTMSTHRLVGIDTDNVQDIDDWIGRLAANGHYLSCSSGTTGKSALLNASAADLKWARKNAIKSLSWGANVKPKGQFLQFGLAPVARTPRNVLTGEALKEAFSRRDNFFEYPVPPITLGQIAGMVALRKRIADGVARPEEITAYDGTSAQRQQLVEGAVGIAAKALVDARQSKLFLSGMWGTLHKVAVAVRAFGCSGADFNSGNILFVAGGLKGAQLPTNYRDYISETFNIAPEHVAINYSMQEIATAMPRCKRGRYHVPPWLILLMVDEPGENLLPTSSGEIVGRAGFIDLSIDGRWNGVISGDKIAVTYAPCACGSRSPSIRDDITRYADLAGGDKITCAGTVDAYVRGL